MPIPLRLRGTWWRHGFVAMAERMLAETGARARLLKATGGARRLTNFLHLIELVEQAVEEHHLTPEGTIPWLPRVCAEPDLFEEAPAELRLETDAEAVQIITVHKSKGLEYAIVFCPFLWDVGQPRNDRPKLAHSDSETVVFHYPPAPDDIGAASENERRANEVRLAYVALTRAKHRCVPHSGI